MSADMNFQQYGRFWMLWSLVFRDFGLSLSPILTLNPLTWKIWWAPNNASRWQMGFNSAFKGLIPLFQPLVTASAQRLCCITLHHITSHHITLHHITLHLQLRAALSALQGFFPLFLLPLAVGTNQTLYIEIVFRSSWCRRSLLLLVPVSVLAVSVFRFQTHKNGAHFSHKGFC